MVGWCACLAHVDNVDEYGSSYMHAGGRVSKACAWFVGTGYAYEAKVVVCMSGGTQHTPNMSVGRKGGVQNGYMGLEYSRRTVHQWCTSGLWCVCTVLHNGCMVGQTY